MKLESKLAMGKYLNDHIKDYRTKLGESRSTFAARYGWSGSSIQSYETYYDIPISKALILGRDMDMDEYYIYITMFKTPQPVHDFKCKFIEDKDLVFNKIHHNYRITTSGELYNRSVDIRQYGESETKDVSPETIKSFETIGINKQQCIKIIQNNFYVDTEDKEDNGVSIEDAIKICKLLNLPFTSAFVLLPKNGVYLGNHEAGNLAYSMDKFIMDESTIQFSFDKIEINITDKEASFLMDVLTSFRKNHG